MKMGRWARILLAAAPLLAGCSNFWQAPSTTTTTTTTLTSGYFFILDATASQVISYYVDAGTLTKVGSVSVPATPIAMAVAPNNKYLCVSTLDGIYSYTIDSGILTQASSTITNDPAVAMAIDPASSSWVVETSGQGTLYAIPVDATSGENSSSLKTLSAKLTGSKVHQIAISPNGAHVFVATDTNGTAEFNSTFTATSGSINSSAYLTLTGDAFSVAVDPSDRLVYVGQINTVSGSGGLRAFTLTNSTGKLAEISGSPLASGGTNPYAILPEATGSYVYVANWNGVSAGVITGFTVTASGSSYTLKKLSTTASTGAEPQALAEDSSEQFVMTVSSYGEPYLSVYVFDTTTASQLDNVITSSTYPGVGLGAIHY